MNTSAEKLSAIQIEFIIKWQRKERQQRERLPRRERLLKKSELNNFCFQRKDAPARAFFLWLKRGKMTVLWPF